MEIALVMEYSTCVKNELVYNTLKKVAEANGHTVTNYGQFNPDDNRQTYIQNAFFISALLNSGAADFVVTGCGTGEGALIAANAMPGVVCGLCSDPTDSFLFTQVNTVTACHFRMLKAGDGQEKLILSIFSRNSSFRSRVEDIRKAQLNQSRKMRHVLQSLNHIHILSLQIFLHLSMTRILLSVSKTDLQAFVMTCLKKDANALRSLQQ